MGAIPSINPSCTWDSSDDLDHDVSLLKDKLESMKEEVSDLKSMMHTLEHDMNQENKEMETLSRKIDHLAFTLEFKINGMKDDLEHLKLKKHKHKLVDSNSD